MKNDLNKHVVAYEGKSLYDYDNNIILNWYAKRIIELTSGACSLLEFGLGLGVTAQIFSKHYANHVVLEGSPAIIDNYRKKYPNDKTKIIETFFENYASSETFDVIVLGFILEHVDDPVKILNNLRRYLTPQGKIFVTVPNAEAMNRRLGHYAGFLKDLNELSDNDIEQGHQRYYTVDSLTKELTSAKYLIEKIEGIYLKPLTTKQLMTLQLDEKITKAMCQLGVAYPELCLGIMAQIK
jgi:2-polyprenyl-3-methyl-5-hydroxy-6-metoxy-1,4-benzoquinol methylase